MRLSDFIQDLIDAEEADIRYSPEAVEMLGEAIANGIHNAGYQVVKRDALSRLFAVADEKELT